MPLGPQSGLAAQGGRQVRAEDELEWRAVSSSPVVSAPHFPRKPSTRLRVALHDARVNQGIAWVGPRANNTRGQSVPRFRALRVGHWNPEVRRELDRPPIAFRSRRRHSWKPFVLQPACIAERAGHRHAARHLQEHRMDVFLRDLRVDSLDPR